jgi:hypothetical protein
MAATFKLNVYCKKEIFHFWSSKKLMFDSRYFYSFTYLTSVTIYIVPPDDPRMHCDLFWEKANLLVLINVDIPRQPTKTTN